MKNEKKIIVFTSVSHFLFHFYEIAFPALTIPLVLSLDMDLKDVIELGFPMYLMFGLFALPWGLFADRYNNRLGLIICFIGGGAGAIMAAFTFKPFFIMMSLAVIGFFACISHPAGMGMISHGVKNVGSALGTFSIAGSVGLVVGPFLAALLNWMAGWQFAYLSIGIFSVCWGVALLFTGIDETPVHRGDDQSNKNENRAVHPLTRLLLFFFIVTLGGLVYRINIVALPAYLEFKVDILASCFESFGLQSLSGTKTVAAATLTSIIYIFGIAGQIYGGKAADRYDLRWPYLLFYLASTPFIILMAYVSGIWLVAASAVYVFFALGMQPIENSLIAKFTPPQWRSTGYGFAAILLFGVGSLAVFVVGWISQLSELGSVYLVSTGLIILIVLSILLLIRNTWGLEIRNISKSSTASIPKSR